MITGLDENYLAFYVWIAVYIYKNKKITPEQAFELIRGNKKIDINKISTNKNYDVNIVNSIEFEKYLIKKYINEKMTIRNICQEIGYSLGTVDKSLHKYNIALRKRGNPNFTCIHL